MKSIRDTGNGKHNRSEIIWEDKDEVTTGSYPGET